MAAPGSSASPKMILLWSTTCGDRAAAQSSDPSSTPWLRRSKNAAMVVLLSVIVAVLIAFVPAFCSGVSISYDRKSICRPMH